jgi:hypothetical protein
MISSIIKVALSKKSYNLTGKSKVLVLVPFLSVKIVPQQ